LKSPRVLASVFVVIVVSAMLAKPAAASDDKKLILGVLSTWDVLNKNVKVNKVVNKTSADGVKTLGGNITLFGQRGGLEVSYFKAKKGDSSGAKSEIRRVMIDFPDKAKLTTRHFRKLFKTDAKKILPGRGGASIGIKHFEIDVLDSKVQSAKVVLTFGSWAPLGGKGRKRVTLSDIESEFGVQDVQTQPKLTARLSARLFLPENLAKTMGIGATSLEMTGLVKTKPLVIELGADLSSREIPLNPKSTLVLKKARFKFVFRGGKPALAIGGKMELRPHNQPPLELNGEVSIDALGTVYAEGWMNQSDYWHNPFGLSKKLYVEKAGLAFGANFATGVPTPIVAIEAGVTIKDNLGGPVRAKGSVTLGLDTGNPTRNMIDLELGSIKFSDFLAAFNKRGVPNNFKKTLDKMTLHKLRLTSVPPGPGVTLFGVDYRPGLSGEADFSYGDFRGTMFIDINDEGVEAFGAMTPLRGKGFSLTGTKRNTGPSLYLALKPAKKVFALAVNGQLEILGAKAATDVYLSDAGFSATMTINIIGGFSTKLDIAGTGLGKDATLYARAHMTDKDGLVKKITQMASAEISRAAKETNSKFNARKRKLESLRPKLAARKRELVAKQKAIRKEYESACKKLDQRKKQEAKKQRQEAAIKKLKAAIKSAEAKLERDRFRSAKNLRSTRCPRGQKKAKNYCWSCPAGTKRDVLQAWDGDKACFTKKSLLAKRKSYRANKGAYVGCKSPLIRDLKRCWQCPKNYKRKLTVHRIDSAKACQMTNQGDRRRPIKSDKLKLAGMEAKLLVITKGLGKLGSELSGVAANSCNKVKDTGAINADPRVAPTFKKWSELSLLVNQGQKGLDLLQKTSVGGLEAAAWITRNGGRVLGIVNIEEASFEGCVSTLDGGKVAMKIRGKLAGKPFEGSFDVNLGSPDRAIKQLAKSLVEKKPLRAKGSNGTCRRPAVPRPQTGGTRIAAKLDALNKSAKKQKKSRPQNKKAKRPSWAKKVQ
jgi:hypothetical protein